MVSSVLMLMSVTSLLAATIALMVKIVSVTISIVSTIALVPMVITQPTVTIPSALDSKVMVGSCYQLVKPPPDVSICVKECNESPCDANVQCHIVNALIILVHTLVPDITIILVMATFVSISTYSTRPYQTETENVVILTETSPN